MEQFMHVHIADIYMCTYGNILQYFSDKLFKVVLAEILTATL